MHHDDYDGDDTYQAVLDVDDPELRARLAFDFGYVQDADDTSDAFCIGDGPYAALNRAISDHEPR